jgi:hypothetical protein
MQQGEQKAQDQIERSCKGSFHKLVVAEMLGVEMGLSAKSGIASRQEPPGRVSRFVCVVTLSFRKDQQQSNVSESRDVVCCFDVTHRWKGFRCLGQDGKCKWRAFGHKDDDERGSMPCPRSQAGFFIAVIPHPLGLEGFSAERPLRRNSAATRFSGMGPFSATTGVACAEEHT